MSCPDVSVIITNFERHEPFQRALTSVLAQKDVSFEVFVVDDASSHPPQSSYQHLQNLGHHLLVSPQRQGPGPCRNWAAKLARGRYLALLDSDDCWLPTKLFRQLTSLKATGFRLGQVGETWIRCGRQITPPKIHRPQAGDLLERSLKAVAISPSSVMLERELYLEHGGFDPEFYVCEDYEFWLRLTAQEPVDLVAEPLTIKYGGHDDQLSRALPAMDRFRLLALAKGLQNGLFQHRAPQAQHEFLRKAEILCLGAIKRQHREAQALCNEATALAKQSDWPQLIKVCRQLLDLWPTKP